MARRSLRRAIQASLKAGVVEATAAEGALGEWLRARDALMVALQSEHGLEEGQVAQALEAWVEKLVWQKQTLSVGDAAEGLKEELSRERDMEKEPQSVWDTAGNATRSSIGECREHEPYALACGWAQCCYLIIVGEAIW